MMREIKFRAWDGNKMRGIDKNDYFSIRNDGLTSSNVNLELMQYTGLKDKNGVEIYEGDVVKVDYRDIRYKPHISHVSWDDKNASFDFGGGVPSEVCWSHEVIGNIYQTPELLENNND